MSLLCAHRLALRKKAGALDKFLRARRSQIYCSFKFVAKRFQLAT